MHPIRAIVGTAGHIDHGKSALVRALTGIEPDRLPEERERGISIELGFAYIDLAGVGRIGIVDVPGHERFIRQMLAGAHGFDLVLVVVAADDGVMPQTEEHFDIVHLLGVQRAIFVVSKVDAAAAERIAEVRGEIEILAVGTRFEDAPVVAVSARTGEGLDELRACIASSLESIREKPAGQGLRIPVDRVFLIKGHGVVVTGTALAGEVRVGDEVLLLPDAPDRPAGRRARVREIQVHGEAVEAARAGQRVALNLAGLDKQDVARGETISAPGAPGPTSRIDARIEVRPAAGRALASHVRVRVHHGTRQTLARLVWLDRVREVAPRSSAYAQLVLEQPLVAGAGDRFVIRDETAQRTLGGGVVLLAHASAHRPAQGAIAPLLQDLESADGATRLLATLNMAAAFGLPPGEAAAAAGITGPSLLALVTDDSRFAILTDERAPQLVVSAARLRTLLERVTAIVAGFQAANPNLPGVDLEHLRGALRPVPEAREFRLLVDRLLASGALVRRGNVVHTRDHAASLGDADERLAQRVLDLLVSSGATPPTVKELAARMSIDAGRLLRVASVLVLRGELVKVSAELFFSQRAIDEIRARLVDHLRREGETTAAGFRDLIAASRKYCIPLLDWFDRAGITVRVGDTRRLRQP